MALVEVGASAGLNLLFDHYGYRLNGGASSTTGASSVVVSCEVRGPSGTDILRTAPRITRRLGIDQQPVDLSDPDARAWLEAFIWPEQTEERPLAQRNSRYLVGASLRGADQHRDQLLGLADPYLRWLSPARDATDDFRWVPAG